MPRIIRMIIVIKIEHSLFDHHCRLLCDLRLLAGLRNGGGAGGNGLVRHDRLGLVLCINDVNRYLKAEKAIISQLG